MDVKNNRLFIYVIVLFYMPANLNGWGVDTGAMPPPPPGYWSESGRATLATPKTLLSFSSKTGLKRGTGKKFGSSVAKVCLQHNNLSIH